MKRFAAWLLLAVTLAYPFTVYWGLHYVEPRSIAFALLGVVLLRIALRAPGPMHATALIACLLALLALVGNVALPLKLYPVAVNAVLLGLFAVSLRRPPTVVERIARLQDPDLSPEGVLYTRTVTIAWCIFFACNGALALVTALRGSAELWAFYNGFLAYLLIGAMFAGEWLCRQRVRARSARV